MFENNVRRCRFLICHLSPPEKSFAVHHAKFFRHSSEKVSQTTVSLNVYMWPFVTDCFMLDVKDDLILFSHKMKTHSVSPLAQQARILSEQCCCMRSRLKPPAASSTWTSRNSSNVRFLSDWFKYNFEYFDRGDPPSLFRFFFQVKQW